MSETNNSNEVVVSIKNLQKAFGDNVVLRDIDLDVHKGEVVVVLGPSGSGKSTMLRCINRLEHPTSGSIVVEGVDVCAKGVDLNKVRTHLGMVFQQFNLFPHLSVKKNVMLAQQKVLKRSKEEAEKILHGRWRYRGGGHAERGLRPPQERAHQGVFGQYLVADQQRLGMRVCLSGRGRSNDAAAPFCISYKGLVVALADF